MNLDLKEAFDSQRQTWLVTGVAGFIGSNLAIRLLDLKQNVIGLDNFITGQRRNVEDVLKHSNECGAGSFKFIEGDICNLDVCQNAVNGVDYVLHQAAIGSVPRSIASPLPSHQANVDGFINLLHSSVQAKIKRFVYASSSSVYGDIAETPKVEARTGSLLSPYAATKAINELYADVFQGIYGIECIGLRYFNVFGPRQDPNGAYAAVIPRWLLAILKGKPIVINGDGLTSRDFCYIENVLQANFRAALVPNSFQKSQVFNVAFGAKTTLIELVIGLSNGLAKAMNCSVANINPQVVYGSFRDGDIRHSLADISLARELLGYQPEFSLAQGLDVTCPWYFLQQDRLV